MLICWCPVGYIGGLLRCGLRVVSMEHRLVSVCAGCSSTDKAFLGRYRCFSLAITDADNFALLKLQMKDVAVHFFLQYVDHPHKWKVHKLQMKE